MNSAGISLFGNGLFLLSLPALPPDPEEAALRQCPGDCVGAILLLPDLVFDARFLFFPKKDGIPPSHAALACAFFLFSVRGLPLAELTLRGADGVYTVRRAQASLVLTEKGRAPLVAVPRRADFPSS